MSYTVAAALGGIAYATVFTALGARDLAGTDHRARLHAPVGGRARWPPRRHRYLSIRQATLGVAASLSGIHVGRGETLALGVSLAILIAAVVGGYAVTTAALRRFPGQGRR